MKKIIPVLISNIINELPEEMENLGTLIEDSYIQISSLSDNWDDEGVAAPDTETLIAAFTFLSNVALFVHKKTKKIISFPDIHPFSDGSIDIYWSTSNMILLVNIEKEPPHEFSYYGQGEMNSSPIIEVQGKGSLDGVEKEDLMNIFL